MPRSRDWPRILSAVLLIVGIGLPAAATAQDNAPAPSLDLGTAPGEDTTGPSSEPIQAPTGQRYYVGCDAHGDGNDGKDPSRAWSTIARANQASLQPGDALLLKRGCVWNGPLNLRWSGTGNKPILIGAYGSGERPQVQNAITQIEITGSYLLIDNVKVRSDPDSTQAVCQNNPIGDRTGISFSSGASYDVVQNSVVADLASGVFFTPGSHNNRLVHSELANNKMMFNADPFANDGGGQAILLEGDFNEVGYNRIYGSLACSTRYGIDGTAIEVYGGQNNTIHHNSTWDNANFTELSLPRTANTIYAYNLVNGHSALTIHPGPTGTKAYNNVFYSTGGSGDNGVVCTECSPSVLTFKNNIVWGQGPLSTGGTPLDEGNNIYWASNGSPYLDVGISSTSQIVDPGFVNPGVDFHLSDNSPALAAGTLESVTSGWSLDLSQITVPQRNQPSEGVYELP
jgi:hypothetical protein